MTTLSPCISICELDECNLWCKGCYRTLQEITDWPCLTEAGKKALLKVLEERRRFTECKA